MAKISVGIDLGTTYSAVAKFNKQTGEAEVLKNSDGKLYTPSVLCIENGRVKIGEEAKQEMAFGNTNTAAFYKSFMGHHSYSLHLDGKDYTPVELSGLFLKHLIKDVESANNVEIESAVITVPAYFNEAQRQATIQAGKDAGLNVLKIINEPTSAIIAYGLTGTTPKNVLVYDLGGGTFDVTIATVNGTAIGVIVTNGDHELGGKNWDHVLIDELVRLFNDEHGVDIAGNPEAYRELQIKAEEAKKKLTDLAFVTVSLQCDGYTGRYEITREFFDERTESLLSQTLQLIKKSFEEVDRKFSWKNIDEVVLVGGSTRMPQVKALIEKEYGKPPVTKNINVDTIVAVGAAIQAELCKAGQLTLGGALAAASPTKTLLLKAEDIQDITAHSLGMLAYNAEATQIINSIILPKNSKLNKAVGKEYIFEGSKLETFVLQGESTDPYYSTLLHKYVISGMPKGKNNLIVDFLYNQDGIVEVKSRLKGGAELKIEKVAIEETLEEVIASLTGGEKEQSGGPLEIIFMVDSSGSMLGKPLKEAQEALREFLSQMDLEHTKVSLLQFANKTHFLCENASDAAEIESGIKNLSNENGVGIGNLSTPLAARGNSFADHDATKVIVVLTDGAWVRPETEIRAAGDLKAQGVTIYSVGFGSAKVEFLEKIASPGCSRKIDLNELKSTFKSIASKIATES